LCGGERLRGSPSRTEDGVVVIRDGRDAGITHNARSRSRRRVSEPTWSPEEARSSARAIAGRAPAVRRIAVAVCEEHEIVRAGLVALLGQDRALSVKVGQPAQVAGEDVDVAVVSSAAAREGCFRCPIVVVGDRPDASPGAALGNDVAAALSRHSLTAAQLLATVHAAAAGLRIQPQNDGGGTTLDARSLRVLELVAEGCSTREIAALMNYSERTIQKLINELQDSMQARSRAQTVAHAMRRGLI
jgi:DNA-binding CsgD family transcriptional regulator